MLLLVEVKARDVLAVFAVGEAEDDLAPEPSRPGQGLVEHRRPVGGADEKDVVVGRLQRLDAQWNARAVERDHARKEQPVQGEVDQGARLPDDHARVVDAVHQDQQHVQAELSATTHHSAEAAHHAAPARARPCLAEGVDLVDEDDAAAPDLRPLAGGADHQVDAQRVDAEEHARKRTAGGDVNRHVQR